MRNIWVFANVCTTFAFTSSEQRLGVVVVMINMPVNRTIKIYTVYSFLVLSIDFCSGLGKLPTGRNSFDGNLNNAIPRPSGAICSAFKYNGSKLFKL